MHRLQHILEVTLGEQMAFPERKLDSVEAFIERFPGVKRVMIDGTERPMQRPQDPERQTLNDSGKKRRHTRKPLTAVDEIKRILVLSRAREGKLHDKTFHDEDDIAGSIPDEIPIEVDLGFLGLQKQYVNIRLPHKNPRGGTLSPGQKAENRTLSQSRVGCENAFAGVKHYALFEPGMHLNVRRSLQIETALRLALDRQELQLHYQPMVTWRLNS